jgi:hypothetical protein
MLTARRYVDDINPIKLEEKLYIWEKQPQEKKIHFQIYEVYLKMEQHKRSIWGLFELLKKSYPEISRSRRVLGFLYHKNLWAKRTAAYDLHHEKLERREREREIKAMTRRHAQLANSAIGVLSSPINEFVKRLNNQAFSLEHVTDVNLLHLVMKASSSLEKLVAIERTARGLPTTVNDSLITIDNASDQQSFAQMVEEAFSRREKAVSHRVIDVVSEEGEAENEVE